MALLWILLFSVLLLISLPTTYGKRDFLMLFDACSTTCNTTYVDVCYCHINKTFSPPRGNLYFHVIRQADEVTYSFEVILLKKNHDKYLLINSTDNDGCAFLEGNNLPTLVQIYRDNLLEFANLPKRCPIEKGFEFLYKDFLLDPERFPPYVPEAKFSIRLAYYVKDKLMLTSELTAEIIQKGSKRWLSKRRRI